MLSVRRDACVPGAGLIAMTLCPSSKYWGTTFRDTRPLHIIFTTRYAQPHLLEFNM